MPCPDSILLVDAAENLLWPLARLLENGGFRVVTARGVGEARKALACRSLRVIVADLDIAREREFELLRWIDAERPSLTTIVTTLGADQETRSEAIRHGVIACLDKPIDLGALFALIRATLGRGSATGASARDSEIRLVAAPPGGDWRT